MTTDETSPEPAELPHELMGRHAETATDMIDFVETLLNHHAPVPKQRGLHFENAGEIRVYEDTADMKVAVLVPLPFLDASNLTTEEIELAIGPLSPAGIKVEVAVAPPPDYG